MKFYFPTTTLNVSNILASSSISPIAFYKKRAFGVPWFEPLEITSGFRDVILLFSKFPIYEILLTNKESYPMIIELDLPEHRIKNTNVDGVYYVSKTIYISPSTTKFYFLTQSDKQKALFRISQGEEAKFSDLYLPNFQIWTEHAFNVDLSTNLLSSILIDEATPNLVEVKNDYVRDKLMGALCGYYIGANCFGNENFAVANDRLKIKQLISSLIQVFYGKDELIEDANTLQHKALNQFVNKSITLPDLCNFESSQKFTINFTKDSLGHCQFFEEILVWIIAKEGINQEEVCTKGGNVMRKYVDGNWEYSIDREYLTRLFYNVTRYESFSLESNQSIILKSFAAFVQRGLGEWEKLIDYLEDRSSAIRDRRFIYGLFGAANGFFSMSKIMTDHIEIPNPELVSFIDDMHAHLESLRIDGLDEQCDLKDSVEEVIINEELKKSDQKKINEALTLEAKQGSTRAFLFILNNLINSRTKIYKELKRQLDESDDSSSSLSDRVYSILRTIKVAPEQLNAVREALKLEQEIGNPQAFCYMLDDMNLSLDIQQKFYDYFQIPYRNESKATGRIKETYNQVKDTIKGLFDDQTLDEMQQEPSASVINHPVYFYNDPNAWFYIEPLIPTDEACKRIKSDLEWFQGIMQKPRGTRGYYDNIDENNNQDVIEKFCSLKMGNDKITGKPKAPYFTQHIREIVKRELFSIYCK